MLIAISGAQGSGKTTVLDHLHDLGYNVIRRKTSRSVLADWGYTLDQVYADPDLTVRFQEEIYNRKLADEADALSNTDQVFFTERTYADLFVYALIVLGKNNTYSSWLDQYYGACLKATKQYHGVFYLKGGHFAPVYDGVRGSNQHYQRLVDDTLFRLTNEMLIDISPIVIDTGSITARVEQITVHTETLLARFGIFNTPME